MPVIWKTKNINIQRYYKAMRRCIMLNGDDGTPMSGWKTWQKFKDQFTITVIPVTEAKNYEQFYKHLNIENIAQIAWGVTGKNVIYWFVIDSNNPRVFMQNLPPGFHELLHALYQMEVGTNHTQYYYDIIIDGIVRQKAGSKGPAATVIVHDNWYGSKKSVRAWFLHSMWVPTRMPFIPIREARAMYDLK